MSESIPTHPQLAALLLAGGQSSRMGEDKAQILWEGKPLLQRVCEVACHCASLVYYITPWPERYESMLNPEHLSGRTVQALSETDHQRGPLGALWEGLSQIEAEWVLLLACDLPLLDPAIVQGWASQLPHLPPESLALVPQQGTLWHPMCGFYRRSALEPLQQFLDQGGRSFQRWLPQIGTTPLEVGTAEFRMLRNFNTPGDLHAPRPE
ncbi:molybdenum cofactor guanylyltransferase [Laspinema olomoucense]|uniref:molybdenum cofactor guanylyltransferase n=1 Tax=Laspinema olomoucense TaxID=3231600 RepID=UPI0021BA503C|nr:molybdenum cofactor guanylyltransferase [Laspinema sp. D3c]MCT7997408.1 molybdenum cofactor guanylyltransferase [Laspinema sp. D3c]